MIETHPITDRAAWLQWRAKDVTASAAAALLGAHPFVTAYALFCEKTGAVPADDEMTEAMERGIELEPLAIRRLAKLHPDWRVWQPETYYRDPDARLGATPDCFAEAPDRPGRGVIQVKSVEPSVFRKKWRNDEGETEPPLWIATQAIIEAHLTGASWAAVAALVISYGIELHMVEVPLHAGIIERVRSETAAFWRMVEEGRTPEPDYGRDGALLSRLFNDPADVEVDCTSDNRLPELMREDKALGETISASQKRRKEIRSEVIHKIGNATFARIAGGRISAKLVSRRGYTVEPTSYRDIRFKEDAA